MSMIPHAYTYDYIQQGSLEMISEVTLALLTTNIFQKHLIKLSVENKCENNLPLLNKNKLYIYGKR